MTLKGEPTANRGFKLRLYPTDEQKKQMQQNMQASRKAYNYALSINLKEYEKWGKIKDTQRASLEERGLSKEEIDKEMEKFNKANKKNYVSSARTLCKKFNNEERKEKEEEWKWLKECDSLSFSDTFGYNYENGLENFNRNFEANKKEVNKKKKKKKYADKVFKYPQDYGFPQFKKYRKALSYPTRILVNHIDIENKKVYVPKIGWVKFAPNQEIPAFMYPSKHLGNPKITTNRRDFFLGFGYYGAFKELPNEKTDMLGVDLGMLNIAILSTGEVVSNFANDKKVKLYEKRMKRLQKLKSKLVDKGKSTVFRPFVLTKEEKENIPKNKRGEVCAKLAKERYKHHTYQEMELVKAIKDTQIKLNNRRTDLLHKACHEIVSKNPAGIIFETLKVKNMQKRKKVASKLQRTGMYKFKSTLVWHAKKNKIPCREVETFYPSSQTCSSCGFINKEMTNLEIREYKCPQCGMIMDRDVNAAINLKNMWNDEKTKPCSGSWEEYEEM